MHAAAPSAVTIADSKRKLFIKCSPHRFGGETPHLLHVCGRKSSRASSPDGPNVTSGVNLTENHRFEFPHFAANVDLRRIAGGGIFLPHYTCRHMHTRSSPSVTERGR
jgi:hypothetical protein